MRTATKVAFNTIVLYVKILLTMAISLITVPMVLHALGQSDYGLYNLIGGIIAMLAFLNNSMSVATQRYMSVAMGQGDLERINRVFNVNIKLHIVLGLIVVFGLELLGLFIFNKLNIEADSIWRARIIYQFLIVTTFIHILTVPFNGVINAREDMVVFSIIGVIDSILVLVVAASLSRLSGDKLLFYGFGMMIVPFVSFVLTFVFVRRAYPEYRIDFKQYSDKSLYKETVGFAGWNLFGAVALMGRNQGTAIIINLFLGTIANAAYGIANQINGAMGQFTSTFQKAINPQLMKSEGMNNRQRMHRISFISSKIGVLAISFFAIPLILEMPEVLLLWLKQDIPPYSIQLSQLILILSIITQYSSGLMSSIQATGRIRDYQIVMSLIILFSLPVSYFILKSGHPIYFVIAGFVVLEVISLIVRLLFSKRITDLVVSDYLKQVLYPTTVIITISTLVGLLPHLLMEQSILRLVITGIAYAFTFVLVFWFLGLDKQQRLSIQSYLSKRINRIN